MKLLSREDLSPQMVALCEQALSGEVVQVRLSNGALLELKPVSPLDSTPLISNAELAGSYADSDWAAFENHCGKSSD